MYDSCTVKDIESNKLGKVRIYFHYPKNSYSTLYTDNSASKVYPYMKTLSETGAQKATSTNTKS